MLNRRICLLIVLLVFLTSIPVYGEDTYKNETLIIYDKARNFGYVEDILLSVRKLLFHFTNSIRYVEIEGLDDIDISTYGHVIVLGLDIDSDFNSVAMALKNYGGRVFWLEDGVDTLLRAKDYGFTVGIDDYSYREIEYKDFNGAIGVKRGFKKVEILDDLVSVKAYLKNSSGKNPFLLRSDNLWYMSKIELSKKIFFILADSLHDFYDVNIYEKSQVYIRIEDVHPFINLEKLRDVGENLYKQNIPFIIALIPAYVSDGSDDITYMSQVPEFVETIKYLESIGGSVILHGFTHQYIADESGEGYEFWDGINDSPLDLDIEQWVKQRLTSALDECAKSGIYPVAFEAPHYAISQHGYKEVGKYFSTVIGHLQNSDGGFATTVYPYALYDTDYGFTIIPENLGYYDAGNPMVLGDLKDNMKSLDIVRGHLGGFFYHSYLGIDGLVDAVDIIKEFDVEFYDIREQDHSVLWNSNQILYSKGRYHINVAVTEQEEKNMIFENTITMLIITLGIIILAQLLIYIRFRAKYKKRLDK